MRNLILLILLISFTSFAHANEVPSAACRQVEQSKFEMDLISQNIANVNTTRTPEGGPYIPRRLSCVEGNCEVVSDASPLFRYDPDHEDANEDGYVPSPNIDMMSELSAMIDATKRWESAQAGCGGQI